MKIPKCPKTVTGKHSWKNWEFAHFGYTDMEMNGLLSFALKSVPPEIIKVDPYCVLCELVDDRKKK